ncbi:MAG TPA: cache domain-containing protein [Actinomycetota bacterium]|nr:cache domain-containing protein [Actinomycetota bacterium]
MYVENEAAVIRLQRERAVAAASTIEQFLRETENLLGWVVLPTSTSEPALEQRRSDFDRLLQLAPSVQAISYLDATGTEQLRVSRGDSGKPAIRSDDTQAAWFLEARSRGASFGPVGFGGRSEPFVTLALAERGTGAGVIVAEVSLDLVRDVISRARSGAGEQTYLVDSQGRLIAHPDTELVSEGTDLSSSALFQAVRAGPFQGRRQFGGAEVADALAPSVLAVSQFDPADERGSGDPLLGYESSRDRLVAYGVIEPVGWIVFVDQPIDVAFAPVRESIVRTALLLLLGLVPAVLASLFLVRRMLIPIRALQMGAARIGEGALDQHIDVRTGDEFETLAEEFNRMAARLRDSYATLQRARERLVTSREEERRRLRRDLHDGLGPMLAGLTLKLGAVRWLLSRDPATAETRLAELEGDVAGIIADIRRLVYDLRPPTLDDLGLVGALQASAARYSPEGGHGNGASGGLRTLVEVPEDLPNLPAAVEVATYRIVDEALTNVVRHAGARTCRVRLWQDGGLHVTISDDGVGLPDNRRAGVGLTSMRERAAELGGTCALETPPEGGTRVTVYLPLSTDEPAATRGGD